MDLFLSQFINKIDKKGRVTLPSIFRNALPKNSKNEIILFKSLKFKSIEGCSADRIKRIASRIDELDIFSDDQEDFSTIYIGAGIPACLMMMVAALSPPHHIFSFGMPAFSSERVYREIQAKAYDRKLRMGNLRDLAIEQSHYILPTDGTFRVSSNYSPPSQILAKHICPTFTKRLIARLTTFPRRGLNLKHHENTSF